MGRIINSTKLLKRHCNKLEFLEIQLRVLGFHGIMYIKIRYLFYFLSACILQLYQMLFNQLTNTKVKRVFSKIDRDSKGNTKL